MHWQKQVAFATKIRFHTVLQPGKASAALASVLHMGKRKASSASLGTEATSDQEQIAQPTVRGSRARHGSKTAAQTDASTSQDTGTVQVKHVATKSKRGKPAEKDKLSLSNDQSEEVAAGNNKPGQKRRRTSGSDNGNTANEKQQDKQNDETAEKPKAKPCTAITGLWLMKNEPEELSMDILLEKPNQTFYWDGVRSYQARNFINQMKVGDKVLFYYSSCKVPGLAGIVKIVKEAYPDHTAWDPKSPYYDPKSDPENPRWMMVDVQFERKLDRFIPLEELRTHKDGVLKGMMLFSHFRLSIQPLSQQHWDALLELEKKQTETDTC